MLKVLLGFRFVTLVAVLTAFAGLLLSFGMSGAKIVEAAGLVFGDEEMPAAHGPDVHSADVATVVIIESIDASLLALVLMMFGFGILVLFVLSDEQRERLHVLPKWMQFAHIGHLKKVLAEVVLVMLFVIFLRQVLVHLGAMSWTILIIPLGVLMLAWALRILQLYEEHAEERADG